jgi:endonuclease I
MRKFLLAFFFLCLFAIANAQIPTGYYNNAYNGALPKTCATLKTALYNIISTGTTVLPYTSSSYDTWDAINSIDTIRNDANTAYRMWDMYTDNPTGPEIVTFTPITMQCGQYAAIGDCYNREHSFPQAWFGSPSTSQNPPAPMLTDMNHIFASDGTSNGRHDNFPYGEVNPSAISWSSPAGARLGNCNYGGYTGKVFEPIDAYKGDFARAMFYMVTRYEDSMAAWQSNSTADAVLDGTPWPSLDQWAIKQWYKWHLIDPVSTKEIIRNNKVYALQNNRNPFIDHPEYVALIWQCTNLLPVTLTNFTASKYNNTIDIKWTTEKEADLKKYEVERSIDGIHFFGLASVEAQNLSSYAINDNNLPAVATVFYRLKMIDLDGKFNYSKTVSIRLNNTLSGITVFPNPATNQITIKLQQALTVNSTFKITDVAGREVIARQSINAGQSLALLKINQLPAGRYVVTMLNDANAQHVSFVIAK